MGAPDAFDFVTVALNICSLHLCKADAQRGLLAPALRALCTGVVPYRYLFSTNIDIHRRWSALNNHHCAVNVYLFSFVIFWQVSCDNFVNCHLQGRIPLTLFSILLTHILKMSFSFIHVCMKHYCCFVGGLALTAWQESVCL